MWYNSLHFVASARHLSLHWLGCNRQHFHSSGRANVAVVIHALLPLIVNSLDMADFAIKLSERKKILEGPCHTLKNTLVLKSKNWLYPFSTTKVHSSSWIFNVGVNFLYSCNALSRFYRISTASRIFPLLNTSLILLIFIYSDLLWTAWSSTLLYPNLFITLHFFRSSFCQRLMVDTFLVQYRHFSEFIVVRLCQLCVYIIHWRLLKQCTAITTRFNPCYNKLCFSVFTQTEHRLITICYRLLKYLPY